MTDTNTNDIDDTTVVIRKEWQNADGSALTPTNAQSATITLKQQKYERNGGDYKTVTVHNKYAWNNTQEGVATYYVKPGTSCTITWNNGYGASGADLTVSTNGGTAETKSFTSESSTAKTYT